MMIVGGPNSGGLYTKRIQDIIYETEERLFVGRNQEIAIMGKKTTGSECSLEIASFLWSCWYWKNKFTPVIYS